MKNQTIQLSIRGLHTYNSELSGTPPGALLQAENVSINRLNLLEPRRGFNNYATSLPNVNDRAYSLFTFKDYKWAHTSTKLYVDIAGWQDRGTISAPANQRLRTAQANNNLFVTTNNGIYKTDSAANSLQLAGVQQAINFSTAVSGASGFLANNFYVAYRIEFARIDENKNLIEGGVSQRQLLQNTSGGTRDVAITAQIPSGIRVGDILRVYRTASSATEPDEEYKQCYETILSSTSPVAFVDNVTDTLLGSYLYTSSSQGGIANQHISLPFAKDLCFYKGHLIAANIRFRHFFNLTINSVGSSGTNTFQNNDTITFVRGVTTITYTGKTSAPGANQFLVSTGGTLSQNIRDTALALATLVNSDATNFLYAYYQSGYNDLPGKLLFEARDLTDTTFSVVSNRGGAFLPVLPSSGTNSLNQSSSDSYKNGISYSEQYEAEHFTDTNFDEVGSPSNAIIRAVALRDAVIFMTEGGVYSMRGSDKFDFSITEIDNTAILLAPECVCVGNNTIYAYLTGGLAAITDSGVTYISTPIKDQLLAIQGPALAEIETYAHAVSYDSEGKIFFWLPSSSGVTSADFCFVFDYYKNEFVKWTVPALCGKIFDDKLYLGDTSTNKIKVERKELDYSDYCDFGDDLTITTDSGTTLILSDTTGMAAGDVIYQDGNYAYVQSVNNSTSAVTVDLDIDWVGTDVTWLKAIPIVVGWNPEFAGNPAGYKNWSECLLLFKRTFLVGARVSFSSDLFTGVSEEEITQPAGSGDFGDFDFGEATFGGEPSKSPIRLSVPRNASKSDLLFVTFEHRVAFSDFQLNGLSLTFSPISTRMTQ